MKKVIYILIILMIPLMLYGNTSKYNRVYNSPNFNIYLKKEIKKNILILKGYIEDNYWCGMNTILIYVSSIDKNGRKIEEKEYYISELEPIPEPGSKKFFIFKFKNADKISKLNFSINFNYEAYKIADITQFEDFSIPLSSIPF